MESVDLSSLTTKAIEPERLELLEKNLREETADVLKRHNWPVREIVNLWSAGDSDYKCDTVLFITPGGIPMTALLGVDENNKAVVDEIWEGWS